MVTPLKTPRGARTLAWRVRTLRNTRLPKQSLRRSHECERGTQECVRHASSSPLVGQQAHGHSLLVAARLHLERLHIYVPQAKAPTPSRSRFGLGILDS